MNDRTTLLVAAIVVMVCVICMTVLVALHDMPANAVEHTIATLVGAIVMFIVPAKSSDGLAGGK
jgi:quinol-cytochrome oxidoreductase complex cytochrome b subunit